MPWFDPSGYVDCGTQSFLVVFVVDPSSEMAEAQMEAYVSVQCHWERGNLSRDCLNRMAADC